MALAPRSAAVFTATLRSWKLAESASKSSIRQFWQIARAISTSRAISVDQPELAGGSGDVRPRSFITNRQLPCVLVLHLWNVETWNRSWYRCRSL